MLGRGVLGMDVVCDEGLLLALLAVGSHIRRRDDNVRNVQRVEIERPRNSYKI